MRGLLALCIASLVSFTAWAHGGEDHGDTAAPALEADIAPRAVAQSEEFELVAILAQGKLTLYLDRYTDNAPVADAEIEVESGAFKAIATPIGPGVYAVPGQAFAKAGNYPMTLAVQTRDSADLLSATLEHPGPAAPPSMRTAAASGRSGLPLPPCCLPAWRCSSCAAAGSAGRDRTPWITK